MTRIKVFENITIIINSPENYWQTIINNNNCNLNKTDVITNRKPKEIYNNFLVNDKRSEKKKKISNKFNCSNINYDIYITILDCLSYNLDIKRSELMANKNICQEINNKKCIDLINKNDRKMNEKHRSFMIKQLHEYNIFMLKMEIKKKQIEKENELCQKNLEMLIKYHELKKNINSTINEFQDEHGNYFGLSLEKFKEAILLSIISEGVNKTYTEIGNKINIILQKNTSINSRHDHKDKIEEHFYRKIFDVLSSYIKEELEITSKRYAIDGSQLKLSINLRNSYSCQNETIIDYEYMKKINELYDEKIKETKDKNEIKNLELSRQKNINQIKRDNMEGFTYKEINNNSENVVNNKNKRYCKSLFSVLYDIDNKFVVEYDETNKFNEVEQAMKLIEKSKIHQGSIIIFDRGYYSNNFLKFLNDRKLIGIFRLSITSSEKIAEMEINNKNDITFYNGFCNFRIVKFTPRIDCQCRNECKCIKDNDKDDYYIGTNSTIKYTIKELGDIYWKRWFEEEFYKKLKHKAKGLFYNTKNVGRYRKNISIQMVALLLSRICLLIASKYNVCIKKIRTYSDKIYERYINFNSCIDITLNNILFDILLSDNSNNNNIKILLNFHLINNTKYTYIRKIHKREAIIDKGKWAYCKLSGKKNNIEPQKERIKKVIQKYKQNQLKREQKLEQKIFKDFSKLASSIMKEEQKDIKKIIKMKN